MFFYQFELFVKIQLSGLKSRMELILSSLVYFVQGALKLFAETAGVYVKVNVRLLCELAASFITFHVALYF